MLVRLIKRLLPAVVKRWIIATQQQLSQAVIWFFSRHRWLASLYYCLFSRRFDREHLAVLKGRLAFMQNQGFKGQSHTLLRRNVHRIEKGLIMRPRKAVFALDYIAQTINALSACQQDPQHDDEEFQWAYNVMQRYFAVVDLQQLPQGVVANFDKIKQALVEKNDVGHRVPYRFDSKVDAKVLPEQFLQLCQQRRSVRWFESKAVDMALIEQAVTMASLAPSACNRQPFEFYVCNQADKAQQLISIPMGTKGFAQNVPCAIVVTADLSHFPTERDRHLIYIDSALATMQLMLALETLGLSSCPINWPDIEQKEQQMVAALDLPLTKRPIMLVAVGYGLAEGEIPYSQKKSAKQLIRRVDL